MSAPQFTPGPWRAVEGRDFAVGQSVTYADGLICHVKTPLREGDAHAEREANARLIAAAPELYAQLEWLLDAYDLGVKGTETTQTLLAKARGEQA